MAKIRIGLIGLGGMGLVHFDRYQKMANAQLAALADIDPRKRAGDVSLIRNNIKTGVEDNSRVDLTGVAVYESGMDLIRQSDVDIVDICTPTPWHAELAIAALQAGKSVMVEKPVARTLEQAAALGAALRDAKGQLNVGVCVRAAPNYRDLYLKHHAGQFGRLRSAVLRRISPTVNDTRHAHWNNWFMRNEYSGGALLDLHYHDTDFICHLLGCPKAVTSFGINVTSDCGIDQVVTRYHYDDGTLVMGEGSWACAPNVPFQQTFELIYEKATVRSMPDGYRIYWNDGTVETPQLSKDDPYTVELQYFVDCIEQGVKADRYQTFEDVLASFKVMMAEEKSVLGHGRRIEIEP